MTKASDSLRLGPEEWFTLTVTREGILPLPERLVRALHLEPGEMVSMERWPGTLYLETMTACLSSLEESLRLERHWSVFKVFLCRPLAVVESNGLDLPIPSNLFPLDPGDRVVLQVLYRGPFPELYLYPGGLAELGRALAHERETRSGPRVKTVGESLLRPPTRRT
jgi:hypothetical protein